MESSTEIAETHRMQQLVSLLAGCRGEKEVRTLVTLALATWLAGFRTEEERDKQLVMMAIAAEKTVPRLEDLVIRRAASDLLGELQ